MACRAPRNFIGCAVSADSRRPAILVTFCRRLGVELFAPLGLHGDLAGLRPLQQCLHHRFDVTDERGGDGLVAVHLVRGDVDLDELGVRVPLRRIAVSEQPVQACADEHHHVGPLQGQRAGGGRRLRVVVGQQTLWPSTSAGTARRWSRRTRGSARRPAHTRRPCRARSAAAWRWPADRSRSRPSRFPAAGAVPG